MRATMGVDVDAGTRAERIRHGRAVRSSRSLAARKQAPLRPGLAQAVLLRWWSGLATAGSFADQKWCPGTLAIARPVKVFPYLSIH